MENRFDTDEQLKKLLGEFEATPDSGSFDAILEKMNRKKKRRAFILFFPAGLIALAAMALSLLFTSNHQSSKTDAPGVNHRASSQNTIDSGHDSIQNHASQQPTLHTLGASADESVKTENTHHISRSNDSHSPGITASLPAAAVHHTTHPKPQANTNNTVSDHSGITQQQTAGASSAEMHKTTHPLSTASGSEKEPDVYASNNITEPESLYMTPIAVSLAADPDQPDITIPLQQAYGAAVPVDSDKKKAFSFYVGLQASPALSSFAFSGNPNMDQGYTTYGTDFPELYLKAKKEQARFRFSPSYGIKAGIRINNTYEVLAGFGYQSFNEIEYLHSEPTSTLSTTTNTALAYAIPPGATSSIHKTFHYTSYSLEVNRLFRSDHALAFKSGLSLYGNHLSSSAYPFDKGPNLSNPVYNNTQFLSSWLLAFKLKAGLVINANRRFQLHLSPGAFYTVTSVYRKDYVIRQKPFGFDIECMLLFRL